MQRRPLRPRWPSPALLISIVALVLALRGVPSSTSTPARSPVALTGNVSRYLITERPLRKHGRQRSVSGARGPTGPPGPAGLTGPAGPTGPSGTASVISHSISFPVAGSAVTVAHLWCPAGQHALGGGYETGSVPSSDTAYAIIDAPIGNIYGGPATEGQVPLGWKVYIQNPATTGTTGQLFAVCTG